MRFLWIYLFLHTVSVQADFGGYYGWSPVCNKWACLNRKFNFTDVQPPKEQYGELVKSLLSADWHAKADDSVAECYAPEATKRYTSTCPGQALMHCVVAKLTERCPSDFWSQNDGCAPVTSLAGTGYMFSQSRYTNMQEYIALERRPSLFLNNYFRSRCCNLQMFESSLLSECGFTKMLHYIYREPQLNTFARNVPNVNFPTHGSTTPAPSVEDPSTNDDVENDDDDTVTRKNGEANAVTQVFNFHLLSEGSTTSAPFVKDPFTDDDVEDEDEVQDPLDCCQQIDDFIQPEWRTECDFTLKWDTERRLSNRHNEEPTLSINNRQCLDLMPATTCVLERLGVLNRWGFVDHFRMKDKIREYSNGKAAYLYAVFNGVYRDFPAYAGQCDSRRRLYNLLDAMLMVCESSSRRTNRHCNKIFADARNSTSVETYKFLDAIVRNSQQKVQYNAGARSMHNSNMQFRSVPTTPPVPRRESVTHNYKRYDFGILGYLGNAPPVSTVDLKPRDETLVLVPVYQRATPKSDTLAINSLHNDGVLRG